MKLVATAVATLSMLVGGGEAAADTGCHAKACFKRVQIKHKKRVVRPWRWWLYSTRMCESGGNYRINTGNGFFGGYQFLPSTWWAVGGRGMPHLAPPLEQDYRAVLLRQRAGTSPWPNCG